MTDQLLELLRRQAIERIDANASGIAMELAEAEDGKIAISMSFKLTKGSHALACESSLTYGRKFKDTGNDIIELPDDQPKLIEVDGRRG